MDNKLIEYYFKVRYLNEGEEVESTINVDNTSISPDSELAKIIIAHKVGDVVQLKYGTQIGQQELVKILEKKTRNKEVSSFQYKTFEKKGYVHVKAANCLYDNEIYFLLYYSSEEADKTETISNNLINAFKRNGYEYKLQEYKKHIVDRFFKKFRLNNYKYVLCCVPGHQQAMSNESNIAKISREICVENGMKDGTNYLLRIKEVIPQTQEINRTIEKHLNSIILNKNANVKGKTIVLLDDFVYSGTTMKACKKILLEAGAKKVICFAMAHVGR